MKPFNEVFLISVLVIFFTGIITVKSTTPQPTEENIKTKSSDKKLPPEIFPKDDTNGSIPLHLQGELPPEIFPDDKALARLHADLITKETNKSDLNNKNNTKEIQHDNKSNKTSAGNRTAKLASEIPDLLNTDYINITSYDDGTENPINNDTEIVQGPHVKNENKTHEEDASSVQRNCSVNETNDENNATLKNGCLVDANVKNESIKTNISNDTVTITPTLLTTEPEIHENSILNTTTEADETTNLNNLTNEYENVTDILEPNNVENDSITLQYNTTIPTTENSTTVTTNNSYNATVEIESNSDNHTTINESVIPAKKEIVVTDKHVFTDSTRTELPSTKFETSSVNISENIIDHKAGAPLALSTSQQHADHSHTTSGRSSAFLQPTESAAILAGVFVGIALFGYVGLLIWRRILEKRYGNREMLVNEDDFYDTNDLRNFEL